ncbi:MAG: glycosyltransferase [Chloroflexi bacterium]|nr:glycosyltransferase [Chloroflexota bacterium]
MRVLVSCVPGYGHLHPMVPLAIALRAAGHEVAIATGADLSPRARAFGFTTFAAGLSIRDAFTRLAERHPDGENNRLAPDDILGWYVPHLFGEVLAPAMLDDLDRLVTTWRPDVLVHDTWELASPVAAAAAGILSVCQTLGPRFSDAVLRVAASAVGPLWQAHHLEPDATAGLYRHVCLDITPPSLQDASAAACSAVQLLRPSPPPLQRDERAPGSITRYADRPLVYMTLGTNTNSDLAVFRAVIDALAELPVNLLVTTGPGRNPSVLGALPSNTHVAEYVAQSLVLPHCSLVICHAGAGTTLASLAFGVPLLALPQGADQYIIAERTIAAGVGLKLAPAEVEPWRVRAAVLRLLNDSTFRVRAAGVRAEIVAMPDARSAADQIARAASVEFAGKSSRD